MFPMFAPHVKAESAYLTDIVQLTTNPYDDRGAGWSPDSSKIAYHAFADSWYRHIWVMNRDGSGKTQLTFGDVVDEGPDYSPDGSKIVFTQYGLRGWGIHDIFIMNADGSGVPERITSTGLARLNVKWSNDGQRLAFYYGGAGTTTNEIHVMNIDGTNEVTVASGTYPVMNAYWSPDDTKLVYSMDDGIWVVDTSPPHQKTRVFQTSLPTMYAVYSPDGNYIMYASGVYPQLQDLYLVDVSGNFIAQLTYDTKFGGGFDWSPDGQYIAFNSISSGNYDVWRARIVIDGAGAGSLVGYWKFDEGSGNIAHDSSGNGNDGTLVNNPQWIDGISGNALILDGTASFVDVPSSSSLVIHGDQVAAEMWIKPAITLDSSTPLMFPLTKGNEYTFSINYRETDPNINDGKIRFDIGIATSDYLRDEGISTTTDHWMANTWYHLAGTYDGNSIKIYVNGVLENSRAVSGELWTQEPTYAEYPLSIGAYTWMEATPPGTIYGRLFFFNGAIDEVKIYNYARTAEEILNDYNSVYGSLFEDDFENYVVGTFPFSGGWELVYNGAGSQYQIVTDAYCNSLIKSLQLLGTNGWSANVQRKFTSDSSLLGYEAYMLAQSNTGPANHVGQAAFWNLQGAPWGKRFAVVQFGEDGNLYTAPIHLGPVYVNMGPYEANRWYHVKVLIDRDAGKYSVWIDDSLKAVDIAIPDTYEINALELESGHAGVKVFFDDVRVFETEPLPPTPLSVSINPISASINVGNSVLFASTVSGGTPPYGYQWYLDNNPISGATLNTWAFTPTTTGSYTVHLNVTDNLGNTAKSNDALITVRAQLVVSISPMSASVLVGQPVAFTSTVSGGYTPYSYQWYLNGDPVSGATSNTWTFTPTTSGIYYVHLKVTDAKANTAQSDAARITTATVPVGGYSIPLKVQTKPEPVLPYIALIATLTAIFTTLKSRIKRRKH